MTTPNDSTPNDPKNSLLDNLREPFQAWVAAGSRLGDVVTDFTGRFREEREDNEVATGAHAKPSPIEDEDTLLGRFKVASQEARAGFSDADSADDYKTVSATFAGRAEEIIRDLADSARRAADETKDSDTVEDAKEAFNSAVASVRGTFDETVAQVRARSNRADADNEDSVIDDLRSRLDDLIKRARTATDQVVGAADTGHATQTSQPSTTTDGPIPHMIDGEVISVDGKPTAHSKDDPKNQG